MRYSLPSTTGGTEVDKQELARCSACRGQSAELYYCERLRGHVCKRCKRKIETRGYTEELDLSELFGRRPS